MNSIFLIAEISVWCGAGLLVVFILKTLSYGPVDSLESKKKCLRFCFLTLGIALVLFGVPLIIIKEIGSGLTFLIPASLLFIGATLSPFLVRLKWLWECP